MGRNNDKAHPPIHPVNFVAPSTLNAEQNRVYEFVTRRFLACCSEDAKGELTQVEINYGGEIFKASGLIVLERNFLDVYPYQKWESNQQLPEYRMGETFIPTEAKMTDGKTSAPGFLTEPELISLMDANGIGTDATMAEHISKIKERQYVSTRLRGSGSEGFEPLEEVEHSAPTRGRSRGRGRGGRQTDAGGRGATRGVEEFIPTNLGVALIEGYENLQFETSLSKPFLRKEVSFLLRQFLALMYKRANLHSFQQMELQMKAICEGQRTRNEVVQQSLEQYRFAYAKTKDQMGVLKAVS
jgi:DNA topoisomerase-3